MRMPSNFLLFDELLSSIVVACTQPDIVNTGAETSQVNNSELRCCHSLSNHTPRHIGDGDGIAAIRLNEKLVCRRVGENTEIIAGALYQSGAGFHNNKYLCGARASVLRGPGKCIYRAGLGRYR